MNLNRALLLIIAVFFLAFPPSGITDDAGSALFIIDILGTNNFDDIHTIEAGIRKADGTLKISVVRSSKNLVRLEGLTKASFKSLTNDICGLALNRFDIEHAVKSDGTLFITLRKKPPSRNL